MQLNNSKYACELLMQCKIINVKKFVFISSCNEYEINDILNDYDVEPRFTCIYGASKLATDIICKTLANNYEIEYNSGLICMIYGENNKSKMLPNIIIDQLNNNISPNLVDGNNLYDLIYIDDVVEAFIAIGEKGKNLKSYYVGNRNLRTFKELLTDIGNFINPNVTLNFGAYNDTRNFNYSKINLDELYNDTGFECKSDFKESILKTAEWLKENQ